MSATLEQGADGVWRITGTLDFESVPVLYKHSAALLAAAPVELDLAGVERANSAGVALLLEWRRQAHRRGVELHLRELPAAVLQLARLSGVEGLINGTDTDTDTGTAPEPDVTVGVARPARRPL